MYFNDTMKILYCLRLRDLVSCLSYPFIFALFGWVFLYKKLQFLYVDSVYICFLYIQATGIQHTNYSIYNDRPERRSNIYKKHIFNINIHIK